VTLRDAVWTNKFNKHRKQPKAMCDNHIIVSGNGYTDERHMGRRAWKMGSPQGSFTLTEPG